MNKKTFPQFYKKCIFLLGLMPVVSFASIEALTPYSVKYNSQVNAILDQVDPQNMWDNLRILTRYPDRASYHESGVQAAEWIKQQMEAMAKKYGRDDVSIYKIEMGYNQLEDEVIETDPHGYGFIKQPNIVVKIGGSSEPAIVIGAHIDTLGCDQEDCKKSEIPNPNSNDGPLPGADDDGSGVVTLMETTRAIFASGQHYKKPIYIIWYASEEGGDLGSQHVVNVFKKQHIPVEVVMQLDQTGYVTNNDPTVFLDVDNTNTALTQYLKKLTQTYIKQPIKYTHGRGASDHLVWDAEGYKTVRIAEDYSNPLPNPYTHSSDDTMDKLSLSHMTDYLKLTLAFIVEIAEPI